jgi:hypothetical protein
MAIIMRGGVGEIEAKAETVRPWTTSPLLIVTMVTPDGKCRRLSRYAVDEIAMLSSKESPNAYLPMTLIIHPFSGII